jgi:hypothetical protein
MGTIMTAEPERIVEVRLILIVLVDVTDSEFVDPSARAKPMSSAQQFVASEVVSNLESLAYVRSVIATSL